MYVVHCSVFDTEPVVLPKAIILVVLLLQFPYGNVFKSDIQALNQPMGTTVNITTKAHIINAAGYTNAK